MSLFQEKEENLVFGAVSGNLDWLRLRESLLRRENTDLTLWRRDFIDLPLANKGP